MSRVHSRLRLAAMSAATLLALYPRLTRAATADNYLGIDQGLWSNPANWSAGIPDNSSAQTYGVVINAPATTVQLDAPVTVDSLTLGFTDSLHILPSASLTLASGSSANAGLIFLDNASGAQGASSPVVPQLLLQTDTYLSGRGVVQLANSGIDAVNAARLISDNFIVGTGAIGSSGGALKVVNLGIITAANGMLTLNASNAPSVTDSFVNMGLLAADHGTLVLAGVNYTNTGGMIAAGPNSVVAVNSGVAINGGTLQAVTGGTITLGNSTQGVVTLTNTAMSGLLQISAGSAAALCGSLTNTGTLTSLGGALNFGARDGSSTPVTLMNTGIIQLGVAEGIAAPSLSINTSLTIAGGGTLSLNGNTFSSTNGSNVPLVLTNANTIIGSGTLGSKGAGPLFNNTGTIIATNGILNVIGSGNTNGVNYNSGTLTANGGTLNLSNFTGNGLTNVGGVISATANSMVSVSNCTIYGGTVRSWDGGTLTLANCLLASVNLRGTIAATSSLDFVGTVTNANTLTAVGSVLFGSGPTAAVIVNAGLIQFGSGSTAQGQATTITISANTTLTGRGTITLNGNSFVSSSSGSVPVTLANDNTIVGYGNLGSSTNTPALNNTGVITASNGVLNLWGSSSSGPLATNTNSGTLSADGGMLSISGLGGLTSSGLNNIGGLIEALPNSTVALNGGTITGGTVQSVGNGSITGYGVTLSNLNLGGYFVAGPLTVVGTLTIANSLTLSGAVYFDTNAGNSPATTLMNTGFIQFSNGPISVNGNTTFAGGGSITLRGSSFGYANSGSVPYTLTNNNTIIGYGALGANATNAPTLNNAGVITASNGLLNLGGNSYVGPSPANANSGTLSASGGTLSISGFGGNGLNNTGGVIEAMPNSVVSFAGGTITGGTIQSLGNGNITGYCTLSNVSLGGNFLMSPLTLTGTVTNMGTLSFIGSVYCGINGSNLTAATLMNTGLIQFSGGWMYVNGNTTLAGGGSIVLSGNNFGFSSNGSAPYILANNNTIIGYGVFGGSGTNAPALNNAGVITASNGLLSLGGTSYTGSFPTNTNSGTLSANGGTLNISNFGGNGLNNTGGLIQALPNSVVSISSGIVTGGIVQSLGNGTITGNSATLNSVNLSGNVVASPLTLIGTVTMGSSLTLRGTVYFGINAGNSTAATLLNTGIIQFPSGALIIINGNTTIGGGGTITLSGNSFGYGSYGSVPYSFSNNNTIIGNGMLGAAGGYAPALNNSGVIVATNGVLQLNLTSFTGTAPVNANSGTLSANGGTLNFSASSSFGLDNSAGVVEALSNSVVSIANGTITGGTVHSLGNGSITGSGATLNNVSLGGNLLTSSVTVVGTLTIANPLTLLGTVNFGLQGSAPSSVNLVNTSTIQVGATAGGTSVALNMWGNVAFSGGGSIILAGNTFNFRSYSTPALLSNANTIVGNGNLGGSGSALNNTGTITATNGSLNLTLYGSSSTSPFYNYNSGVLSANGGTLNISGSNTAGLINSGGVIEALPNSAINVAVNISGGIIEAMPNSAVVVSFPYNMSVTDATIKVLNGGTLSMAGAFDRDIINCDAGAICTGTPTISNSTLSGVFQNSVLSAYSGSGGTAFGGTITNAGTLVLVGTYYLGVSQGQTATTTVLQNNGVIQFGTSSPGAIGIIGFDGNNFTFSGGGTIVLNGCNSVSQGGPGMTRVTNSNTILGSGTLGSTDDWRGSWGAFYTNTGTITATTGVLSFVTISFDGTPGDNYNSGYVGAKGGTLVISGWAQDITTINTGGTIEAQANSVVTLVNQAITGGIVDAVGGGTVTLTNCVLTDTQMQGNFQLTGTAPSTLMGTLINRGTLMLSGGSSGQLLTLGSVAGPGLVVIFNPGLIQFSPGFSFSLCGDLLLTGGGSLALAGSSLQSATTGRLTTDNRITGFGTLAPTTLTNEGTITATAGTLTVNTSGSAGGCVNPGTLAADAGTLVLSGGPISNSGLIFARNDGRVSLQTSVDGGTLIVASGGVLGLDAANVIGPDCIITFKGGSLQYGPLNASDYSPQFSQAPAQAYVIDTNGQTVSFATPLTSTNGSFTKLGAGTLTFNVDNTYNGGTNLNGGILSLGSANALGPTGTITFGGGGLQFSPVNITDYSARFSQAPAQQYMLDTNGQTITLATGLTSVGGSVTKLGAGSLILTGAANYYGPTTISAGTLEFSGGVSHNIGSVSGTGALLVDANTTLASDGVNLLNGTWTINGTQLIRPSASGGAYANRCLGQDSTVLSGTSVTSNLTFGPAAKLDLQNNALIVEATSANLSTLLAQIAADVTQGYITSSTAASNSAYTLVVAVDNSNINTQKFGGMPVDANSIIVTEALKGDANLDGYVDLNDLNIWLSNLGISSSAYAASTGDLNNDGFVDLNDFNQWLSNLGHQVTANSVPALASGGSPAQGDDLLSGGMSSGGMSSAALSSAGVPAGGAVAVPEPASLALLGLGLLGLLTRRRSDRR